jgi:hypothetical protein
MTDQELAKQLTTYADGITALSWIQTIGLCYAIANDNASTGRILTNHGPALTALAIMFGTVAYSTLVYICSDKAQSLEVSLSESQDKILNNLRYGRIVIVAVGGAVSLLALLITKMAL